MDTQCGCFNKLWGEFCNSASPSVLTEPSDDMKQWPDICYIDIVNYLVFPDGVDGKELCNYKSTEAYNYLHSNEIGKVLVLTKIRLELVVYLTTLLWEERVVVCVLTMFRFWVIDLFEYVNIYPTLPNWILPHKSVAYHIKTSWARLLTCVVSVHSQT